MKFEELDLKMRIYETTHDQVVLPDVYMVARLDGRGFTKLTKEMHSFDAPFDTRFRDYMIDTTKHLMQCGFHVVYAYTESDEISLLFHYDETAFSRKLRKYHSILAGEASARFSLLLGGAGVFDCRICELPNKQLVADYFRWRNEDACRNALNAYCYWKLRQDNYTGREATKRIERCSIAEKNEILFGYGINFNDLPSWQKRGTGIYWLQVEKDGYNPDTGQKVTALRRELFVDMELPMKDAYHNFILKFLD